MEITSEQIRKARKIILESSKYERHRYAIVAKGDQEALEAAMGVLGFINCTIDDSMEEGVLEIRNLQEQLTQNVNCSSY